MSDAPVIIEPRAPADACVIWLHGLGADGHDFEPVVPYLGEALVSHTRFVFPHAPMQPVTVNGGYVMRAWYDIAEVDLERRPDEAGIRDSATLLEGWLREQRDTGLAADRIVLAGFSQGGAIALHAALRLQETVAGVLALSTYLPLAEKAAAEVTETGRAHAVMMAHGTADPIVPLAAAERSVSVLGELGVGVDFHRYPMQHELCAEELADITAWLGSRLPPS